MPGYSFTGLPVKCAPATTGQKGSGGLKPSDCLKTGFSGSRRKLTRNFRISLLSRKFPGPSTMKEQKKRDEVRKYYIHADKK
jgi:hypothetical protein